MVAAVALRDVETAAHPGAEVDVDVLTVTVSVAVAAPVEAVLLLSVNHHFQVAVAHPAVGTVLVVDGHLDANGVRTVERHLILPSVVDVCGRRPPGSHHEEQQQRCHAQRAEKAVTMLTPETGTGTGTGTGTQASRLRLFAGETPTLLGGGMGRHGHAPGSCRCVHIYSC